MSFSEKRTISAHICHSSSSLFFVWEEDPGKKNTNFISLSYTSTHHSFLSGTLFGQLCSTLHAELLVEAIERVYKWTNVPDFYCGLFVSVFFSLAILNLAFQVAKNFS